jgi:hypothetical protein
MFALVSAAWWQGRTFLQLGSDSPEHLHKPGEQQPVQCFFVAAEKVGPNLFKACLQRGCKLALVCGRLKSALHLMQLHSLFPAVCCLSSSCQEREGILNNGCCRTNNGCLPQADRQCRGQSLRCCCRMKSISARLFSRKPARSLSEDRSGAPSYSRTKTSSRVRSAKSPGKSFSTSRNVISRGTSTSSVACKRSLPLESQTRTVRTRLITTC